MDTIEFQKYEQVARNLKYDRVVDITNTATKQNISNILNQFNRENIMGVAQYNSNNKWMYFNPSRSIKADQHSILVCMKGHVVFTPCGSSVESIERTLANYRFANEDTDTCNICFSYNKGVHIICNQCNKSFCATCHVRLVIHGIRDHADIVTICPFCRFMDESYRIEHQRLLRDANLRSFRYSVYDMVKNVVHNVIQYMHTGVITRDTAERLCDYAVRELL